MRHLTLVIIVLLLSACAKTPPKESNTSQGVDWDKLAKSEKTQTALSNIVLMIINLQKEKFIESLKKFKADNNRFPYSNEGLAFLFENTSNLKTWNGPYIIESMKSAVGGFSYTYNEDELPNLKSVGN